MGPLWYWFQGYLTDRSHFVQYRGAISITLPVISGVALGSVLGPQLFPFTSMTFLMLLFHLALR